MSCSTVISNNLLLWRLLFGLGRIKMSRQYNSNSRSRSSSSCSNSGNNGNDNIDRNMVAMQDYVERFNRWQNAVSSNFVGFEPLRGPARNNSNDRLNRPKRGEIKGKRSWQNTYINKKLNPGFTFTIMNYNVLAQDLVTQHPHLYTKHDPEAMNWTMRWKNLLAEITQHNCDIMCLQEVQESHLDQFYREEFKKLGYDGIFKKRTGEYPDGCAIFYKTNLLDLKEYTTIEYNQQKFEILNRNNVGIIAKFAPKTGNKEINNEFVVATTHLLYNRKRYDVRLAQTILLLAELDRLAYKNESEYLPVIITGDFNSEPTSPVLKLLKERNMEQLVVLPKDLQITDNCQHLAIFEKRLGKVNMSREEELSQISLSHSERRQKGDLNVQKRSRERKEQFGSGKLSHNFPLSLVYNPEVGVTTFQDKWVTVDYIFYSDYKLRMLSRYLLPTRQDLNGITIPNSSLGSDHLSLIAKFHLEN